MTTDDMQLVREYARSGSEDAFAALVSRHVNLVYSVALRQAQDPHLAEEITQTVFVILARKAGSLKAQTVVSGWLCQTARYAAAKALTMRRRRQNREHEAFMQSTPNETNEAETWMQIEPLLDTAMGQLGRKDHDALVVRFLEGRNFKEVSAALGTTEAGAKMRVNRALEKLRRIFTQRGITLSAAMIAAAVSAHSVQAAPVGLAASATLAAVQGTAVTGTTFSLIQTTLKYMAWTKVKTATTVGLIGLLAVGTATIATKDSEKAPPPAAEKFVASYVTPEATLKTLIEALKRADTELFAAGCTPEKAEQFRSRNFGKTKEELDREATGMAQAFSKFEILERKVISESEVHLRVNALGDTKDAPHGDRNSVLRMKKIGADWKFDGNQN